ncbi:MAG: integration host factor subunit beta [Treponema sp.]|uniref:HU family DNA-binding protein n=1 Tax=Treponema sp. TaxID=166 RepID=UPI001D5F925B|nr:HU family DNA-binding protein [Treponema sp.]MBS7309839.1 integration host factor subunit beta [Treponema sp.]MDD5811325.1 integration host factor subunit beta [Treponema sp.]MDY5885697.1 HU family DNA-binding protein [Treponema sp.]
MADDKLTKIDLVESVYLNTKIEKQDVQKVIDNLLEQLKSSMSDGKTIELRGFGTFEKRLRKGRAKARNPKTGEIVSVEPHYVAVFRPGRELKNAISDLPVDDESK